MAKGEPMLRDLRHEDTYAVVEHDVLMPDVAKIFINKPDQAVLVYQKKKDKIEHDVGIIITGPPGLLFSMQSAIGFPDADLVITVVAKGTLIIT